MKDFEKIFFRRFCRFEFIDKRLVNWEIFFLAKLQPDLSGNPFLLILKFFLDWKRGAKKIVVRYANQHPSDKQHQRTFHLVAIFYKFVIV